MKIRVLRNLGKGLPPYKEGQIVDCPTEEAQALIDRKLAVADTTKKAAEPKPETETKPSKPEGKKTEAK